MSDLQLTPGEITAAKSLAALLIECCPELMDSVLREVRNRLVMQMLVAGLDLPEALDRTHAFITEMATQMRASSEVMH